MIPRLVRPHWPLAAALVPLLLISTGVQLAGPGLLGAFVDGAVDGATPARLTVLGAAAVAAAVGGGAVAVAAEAVGGRLGWRVTNELRAELLSHCLHADLGFHDRHSPGELIARVDGDTDRLAEFASRLLILLAVNTLLLIGVVAMLTGIDPRIGLGCALLLGLALARVRRLLGSAVDATAEVRRVAAGLSGHIEENLRAAEDLVPNGGTEHAVHGLVLRNREMYEARRAGVRAAVRWPRAAQHLHWIAVVGGLAGSIALYRSGAVSIGEVYAVTAFLTLMRFPIIVIVNNMSTVDDALAALRRCRELLAERPAVVSGDVPVPAGALSVEFDGVDFGYDDRAVLRDVRLSVPAGRPLALVGPTGAGKSTIARLLTRMADPSAGAVRVGGVDLRTADTASLRSAVTYVTQEVRVLAASVRDNLALYDGEVPDERMLDVLDRTGLGAWLADRPEGLDTVLGGATRLSAGQEQLLAVARALLRDPGLVVLDEASSRIPPADRRAVDRAVRALLHGRTALIIAHRLDTVADADEVAVIDDGRVAERGTYTALSADPASRLSAALAAAEGTAA